MCLDTLGEHYLSKVGVYPCIESSENQLFSFTNTDQIRLNDFCFSADNTASPGHNLKMASCSSAENQKWSHTKGGPIVNRKTGLCIDITDVNTHGMAKLEKCDSNKLGQKWTWLNYA